MHAIHQDDYEALTFRDAFRMATLEGARAIGLELDLTARGMGVRSQRYAMIVDNGTVADIAVEAPGAFEVSSAEAVLGIVREAAPSPETTLDAQSARAEAHAATPALLAHPDERAARDVTVLRVLAHV